MSFLPNKLSPAIVVFVVSIISCDIAENINEIIDSKITAKEKISEVMNAAKSDFAVDAKLAAIFQ